MIGKTNKQTNRQYISGIKERTCSSETYVGLFTQAGMPENQRAAQHDCWRRDRDRCGAFLAAGSACHACGTGVSAGGWQQAHPYVPHP